MIWNRQINSGKLELTLLHAGVQLGDLAGQAVDPVLEWVGAPVKGVGLVKKLPKNIFCVFTCNQSKEKWDVRTWTHWETPHWGYKSSEK